VRDVGRPPPPPARGDTWRGAPPPVSRKAAHMSPSPDHTPPSPAPSSISFQFDAVVARLRVAGCVFAEDEARLLIAGAADLADLETMIDRRVAGLPLEHILGWA